MAAKGSRVLKAVRLQDAEHHCRVNPIAEPDQKKYGPRGALIDLRGGRSSLKALHGDSQVQYLAERSTNRAVN
jgi:hypothetical protein